MPADRATIALLAFTCVVGCNRRPSPVQAEAAALADPGTLVQQCDAEGKCNGAWACFENRCIPPSLLRNPEQHREPLLFIFESFEAIVAYGARPLEDGLYHCPGARAGRVDTGLTPPADVRCSEAPEGRCVPGGEGPGAYSPALWDHPGWKDMQLRTSLPHRFHYRYVGEEEKAPQGRCVFMVQAFGDLDGDGVFSTFERSGMYDHTGPNAAAGLYIEWGLDLE